MVDGPVALETKLPGCLYTRLVGGDSVQQARAPVEEQKSNASAR